MRRRLSRPKPYLLDKRAAQIATLGESQPPDHDKLLTTPEVARWLGVAPQWLETCRRRDEGPAYIRVNARKIRYRRDAVMAWLREREQLATAGGGR
jgi:hypothetical protein